MGATRFGTAVVIGGSMAGLLAARVLADYFDSVTIIERDSRGERPEFRRGVPQGRHAHALLLRGLQTVDRLFPDVRDALLQSGATPLNMGRDMRWFHFGVWKCRFETSLQGISASRPLVEWTVAEHLRRVSRVKTMEGYSVEGLVAANGAIHGVRVRPRGEAGGDQVLPADLVIDASGRGSQTPLQLQKLGFAKPEETSVKIDVGYSTRIYRVPAAPRDWKALFVIAQPPSKRAALILPIENGRWIVTEAGMHGDHPPADERGFLEYARSLPAPDLYEAIRDAEPVSEFMRYGFPAGLRRRYEHVRRFPEGLLVLGDALCSFNPIYGQGMSAAGMYADALNACLQQRAETGRSLDGMWKNFFPLAAAAADMPWQLATSEDFRYPETAGPRTAMMRFMHWYTGRVQVACGHDPHVAQRMYEVMHLLKAPSALLKPDIARRVLVPRSTSNREALASQRQRAHAMAGGGIDRVAERRS